jgi:hypothetical protein
MDYATRIYLLKNTLHLSFCFHHGTNFEGWEQRRVLGNALDRYRGQKWGTEVHQCSGVPTTFMLT